MDFVVVRVNGKDLKARSLEETLEDMPHSNESIVVELRRKDSNHDNNLNHSKSSPHQTTQDHNFIGTSHENFQTFSSSDDPVASSTITSDYICIDRGRDPDDDDNDDDYDDLELWCGSKEISSNFITHMTNCKVCSEASDIHLSLLESLQQLEESESEDEENNNNNNLEYDEVVDDIKSFESDSALDDSMVHDAYRDDPHYHYYSQVNSRKLKNIRHNSTDTTISSNHDDSAIGRTDESIRADESSEQELVDNYGVYPYCLSKSYHFESSKQLSSSDLSSGNNSINITNTIFINELADKFASTDLLTSLPSIRVLRRSRKVPRMGTKLSKHNSNELQVLPQNLEENQVWLRQSNLNLSSTIPRHNDPANVEKSDKFKSNSSSKSSLSDHSKENADSEKHHEKSQLDPSVYTPLKVSSSRTPHFPKRCLRSGSSFKGGKNVKNVSFNISENQFAPTSDNIDADNYMHLTNVVNGNAVDSQNLKAAQTSSDENKIPKITPIIKSEEENGDLLRKLYSQHIDVMYTNQANLEHTMLVQQKLFTQQLHLLHKNRKSRIDQKNSSSCFHAPDESTNQNSSSEMQWVMRRRSDGSRYITRRPAKKEKSRKRADRFSEERKEVTTDDDAGSELKAGKYWTREERREQVREKKNKMKLKMDTVCENDDTPSSNHRQHHRSSDKKEKSLQHIHKVKTKEGHRIEVPLPFIKGHLQSLLLKTGNQLLSVTTV